MKYYHLIILIVHIYSCEGIVCGCKTLRPCYETMLDELISEGETKCIEDAAVGESSMTVFLKALQEYCGDIIQVVNEFTTYEGRLLNEVIINETVKHDTQEDTRPVILIDAGQQGGTESASLALFIIEQLMACEENSEMITNARWVILPCANPDGQEFARFGYQKNWQKNLQPSTNGLSIGVDISSNFDFQWSTCRSNTGGFSPNYRGPSAGSEKETKFIKNVLEKYKSNIKVYISIRRNGHALLYPYAYTKDTALNIEDLMKVADEVTSRVNRRSGTVNLFVNSSIYEYENKPICGHSVDYAHSIGIPMSFEMRVFLGSDNRILSKFRTMPRGYEASLRNGYFTGIREFYNIIIREKKK